MNIIRKLLILPITCLFVMIFAIGCKNHSDLPNISFDDSFLTIKNSRLYFTKNVSKDQVDALEKYLKAIEFFNNDTIMKFDESTSGEFQISLYVPKWVFEDDTEEKYFQDVADDISFNVFGGNIVVVTLCDDDFKPIKSFNSKS